MHLSASNGVLPEMVLQFSPAYPHSRCRTTGKFLLMETPKADMDDDTLPGVAFTCGAAFSCDGQIISNPAALRVKDASCCTLYIAIRSSFNGAHIIPEAMPDKCSEIVLVDLQNAMETGFENIRKSHIEDHRRLYSKSVFAVPETPEDKLPTDRRLEAAAAGEQVPPGMAALLYNYGRYLLIASSRPGTLPANLQGIWNPLRHPPWGSKFITNINLEMNYWPAECANLAECAEPLFRFISDMSRHGIKTARELYHADGWCMHHHSDIWLHSTPATGATQYLFWNACGGWLCRHLAEHLDYGATGKFLEQTALPALRGAAGFY